MNLQNQILSKESKSRKDMQRIILFMKIKVTETQHESDSLFMETYAVKYQLMWFPLGRWKGGREAAREGEEMEKVWILL